MSLEEIIDLIYIDLETCSNLTDLKAITHIGKFVAEKPVMREDEVTDEIETFEIGSFRCYFFPYFNVLDDTPLDVLDLADEIDGDCLWAVSFLVDKNGPIKEEHTLKSGILYIDEFKIKPKYEMLKKTAMENLISILGHSASAITYIVDYESDDELSGPFLGEFDFVMHDTNDKSSIWIREQV